MTAETKLYGPLDMDVQGLQLLLDDAVSLNPARVLHQE
jgi:hypothetical protein